MTNERMTGEMLGKICNEVKTEARNEAIDEMREAALAKSTYMIHACKPQWCVNVKDIEEIAARLKRQP